MAECSAFPSFDGRTRTGPLRVCAPMVRYSKLPFRTLVRKYDCDLCYTPMLVASSFVHSAKARDADFTTEPADAPLIVQFAAADPTQLAQAATLVAPFVAGVDLNCGCPQKWAMSDGLGSHLIRHPELVASMIAETRNAVLPSTSGQQFQFSIKIRILDDDRRTVDLCQKAVHAGVTLLTVHGRTPRERHQPVHTEVFKLVRSAVSIPVIANGDVFSLDEGLRLAQETGVAGVMSARGILGNPALFAGYAETPRQCIEDWIEIALGFGVGFVQFHHHLMFMLDSQLSRAEKQIFNRLQSTPAVLDFIENYFQRTERNSNSAT